MNKKKMNCNSVIYEPDFIILNNELLTSLCVYFDELILISNRSIDDELYRIKENKDSGYMVKKEYVNTVLKPLVQEGVITLYDSNEICEICPNSLEIDLGDMEIKQVEDAVHLDIKSLNDNRISRAMVEMLLKENCKVGDLVRLISVYSLSMEYNIPIIKNTIQKGRYGAQELSDLLAMKVLCKLAMPQITTTNCEDIIKIRKELKDELIEFRAGILDLTYLLYQSLKATPNDKQNISQEIDMLVDTKINSAVLSLEHKLSDSKRSRVPNIILNGGKFLMSGALLALGIENQESTLSNGASFLQSVLDMKSLKNEPQDKIASYIVSLSKYL